MAFLSLTHIGPLTKGHKNWPILVFRFCDFGPEKLVVLVSLCSFPVLASLLYALDKLYKILRTILKVTSSSAQQHKEAVFVLLRKGAT